MDALRVRAYNVGFGDAILVTWPEGNAGNKRNLLIDVGNVLQKGGEDVVFEPVLTDIVSELDGRPIDLYVGTHEHLDHVQGLYYGATKLGIELKARYAWLTASAHPEYYERNDDARRQIEVARRTFAAVRHNVLAVEDPESLPVWAHTMLINNDALLADGNPSRVGECVEHLRNIGDETFYVHRESDVSGMHPFDEATLSLWAPEENTATYYGRFEPQRMQPIAPLTTAAWSELDAGIVPPPGVDAGAFYDLIASRQQGNFDHLLAIDRAANNTSIVLHLQWRGWKLLFSGDAEERSWKTMADRDVLEPIHFLKVSHHGSANGTPPTDILDQILPPKPADRRPRHALVSTHRKVYSGVPSKPTLDRISRRAELHNTMDVPEGRYLDVILHA